MRGIETRFAQRSESNESIWTFRVERFDEAGNRVQLVPVEMRGYAFEGSISDGDWVRAHGKFRKGTFRVDNVENVTTGASVHAKRPPMIVRVILRIFLIAFVLFVLGWIGWGFFQAFTVGGL